MNAFLARSLYFGLQKLRGEPIRQALDDLRRTEFLTQEELHRLQAERQLSQLRFAVANVPHYAESFAPFVKEIQTANTWDHVSSLMGRLPIVEKGSVMSDREKFKASNCAKIPSFTDRTSGSTGTPLTFPCDQRAWAYRHGLTFRCMESFKVRIGEPYALFWGLHWNRLERLRAKMRDWVLNRVRISAYDLAPDNVQAHLERVTRFRPTHLIGYPSAIQEFCTLIKERASDLKSLRLKAIFLTSEPLRAEQRAFIEEVTGARCVNIYGSAEGGLAAFECPHGSLHISAEATWFEYRQHPDGAYEAIVTDMMLRAFPLIRYAMGDEVAPMPGTCGCGRPHPMLHSIEGRSGDHIVLPNGKRVSPHVVGYLFRPFGSLGVLRRYRFIQVGDRELRLYLVVTKSFRKDHLPMIGAEARKAFGKDVPLKITVVESLPLMANAKHRAFIRVESEDEARQLTTNR